MNFARLFRHHVMKFSIPNISEESYPVPSPAGATGPYGPGPLIKKDQNVSKEPPIFTKFI